MTTTEMLRKSKLDIYGLGCPHDKFIECVQAFAELVRADERNSWPAEMEAMERQVNILTDALAQEREACVIAIQKIGQHGIITQCVAAIRARSST